MPENELARVLDASGPFASIYMDTSGDVEDAAHRVAVRWKNLRGELARAGMAEATLEAIDPLVDGSHTAGALTKLVDHGPGEKGPGGPAPTEGLGALLRFAGPPPLRGPDGAALPEGGSHDRHPSGPPR